MRLRRAESGVAIITAIMLTLIGVMLITTIASIIVANMQVMTSTSDRARARMGAISAIQYIIADLIDDRPALSASSGVIITEVKNAVDTNVYNLVGDPGFEIYSSSFDSWTATGTVNQLTSATTPKRRSGSSACRFDNLTSSWGGRIIQSGKFAVKGGNFLTRSAWIYYYHPTAASTCTTVNIAMLTRFYNSVGTEIAVDSYIMAMSVNDSSSTDDATKWKKMTPPDTPIPANAVSASVEFNGYRYLTGTSATNEDVGIDDVYVAEVNGQRRYQYIEIQNTTNATINLNTAQSWLSTGNEYGYAGRLIYPLSYEVDEADKWNLDPGELGVVIASDADTAWMATRYSIDTHQIKWFMLRSTATAPYDTMLGYAGQSPLADAAGEYLVIGRDSTGAAVSWAGFHLPTSLVTSTVDTSWQKSSALPFDETAVISAAHSYSALASNWKSDGCNPGVGIATGRAGVDGAGDEWYRCNYESCTKLYSANGRDVYYRVRTFDEGGKVNVNYIATKGHNGWESGVLINLLQQRPKPPFYLATKYCDGMGADSAARLTYAFIQFGDSTASGKTRFLTPSTMYLACGQDTAIGKYIWLRAVHFPYLTIYDYLDNYGFQINVNTAESVALRAAFINALANTTYYPALTAAQAKAHVESLADSIYIFLTKNDFNVSNDVALTAATDVCTLGDAADNVIMTNSFSSVDPMLNLGNYLTVAGNHFFTIYSTAFVFKSGANPDVDTPLAQYRITTVVHRNTATPTADIVYWRETAETSEKEPYSRAMTYPIGTCRFPWFKWDPTQ